MAMAMATATVIEILSGLPVGLGKRAPEGPPGGERSEQQPVPAIWAWSISGSNWPVAKC